jgi:hypothetical protein
MSDRRTNLFMVGKIEKRNNRIFWKWLGFGLMVLSGLAIERIMSEAGSIQSESAIVYLFILILLLLIFMIGFCFFILKEPKRKIKMIKIILILPFFLRILSFYEWIPPVKIIFTPLKFQAKMMEEKALKKGEVDYCFKIGRIPIFSDFIFQGLKDEFIAYLQKDCIVALAKDRGDETICANLKSKRISHAYCHSYIGHEADCYTEVAKIKKDPLICEKAKPSDQCYREFF